MSETNHKENNMEKQKSSLKKITGLYKKTSKDGETNYLEGSIKLGSHESALAMYIKLFPVKNKTNEKAPDYSITADYKDNQLGLLNLGGLWKQQDKNGETFLTGRFNNYYIKVLKNTFKEKDSEPDYNVFFSQMEKKAE